MNNGNGNTKRKDPEKQHCRSKVNARQFKAGKELKALAKYCCHAVNKILCHKKGTASSTKATILIKTRIATSVTIERAIPTTQGGKIAHNVIMTEATKDIT